MERTRLVRGPDGNIIGVAAVRNDQWVNAAGRVKARDLRRSSSPPSRVGGSRASPTIKVPTGTVPVTTVKSQPAAQRPHFPQYSTPQAELRHMGGQTENGDWHIIGQKTKAKVTRSFVQSGERRTEEEWPVGKPSEVRRACAPKYAGEVTELEWVYTNTDLRRYVHENTTHGITKRDEFRTVQSADFGDGKSIPTASNPQGAIYRNPEDRAAMEQATGKPSDKVDYLKNMHDKLQDQVTQQQSDDKSDKRALWMFLAITAVIAVAAIVIAGVY